MPFTGPAGPGGLVLVGLALALSVSLEELLYRVYYLERLRLLGAGAPAAVGIAVCLFSLGHHYQGITGLVLSLVLGVVLCLAWLRWRRFWPLWLGHLAYNLTVLAASGSQPQA
jgi:membrane protease YdiL (CAAX protease family)